MSITQQVRATPAQIERLWEDYPMGGGLEELYFSNGRDGQLFVQAPGEEGYAIIEEDGEEITYA